METARKADAASGPARSVKPFEARWLARHRTMLLLIVVVFAACLFGATANQPFHLDNMDFPAAAIATSTTGLPIYYRGEDNPRHLGLYHPPLFIYLLAAWI